MKGRSRLILPPSLIANGAARDRVGWKYLTLILIAPTVLAVLRKIAPGQPVAFEILPSGLVMLAGVWAIVQRRPPPRWLAVPLLIWAYFLLIYAGAAVSYDWKIGAAATITRIVPIFMAWIAYVTIRNVDDFRRMSRIVGVIALVLVPPAIVMALFGNDVLPGVLQAIGESQELGGSRRGGVPAFSGFYSTFHVMGLTSLVFLFLALANAALSEVTDRTNNALWWVIAAAGLLLAYLSTRRGVLIAAVLGLVGYLFIRKRISLRLAFSGFVILVVAFLIEYRGSVVGGGLERRAELFIGLDFNDVLYRLTNVFGIVFWRWLSEAPIWGNFLGFAGPEGSALAGRLLYTRYVGYVEVGGAQLLAETGVIGALLMPAVIGALAFLAVLNARRLRCKYAVYMLVLYQLLFYALYYVKELSAMGQPNTHLLFFWAVPGICAALIERERSERKVGRWIMAQMQSERPAAAHERS